MSSDGEQGGTMGEQHGGESLRGDGLAPVIPLFGREPQDDASDSASGTPQDQWHKSWISEAVHRGDGDMAVESERDETSRADVCAAAEKALLKKLRSRSLSEREARTVLAGHELADDEVEGIIGVLLGHGYLDDARLAEQLIHTATDRKAQGRSAIAHSLSARGIPRIVIDEALAEAPDDDEERALAFARSKVRSFASLDRDTALRRLHGQLARRGFAGSLAMSAARQALDEAGNTASRVRFR